MPFTKILSLGADLLAAMTHTLCAAQQSKLCIPPCVQVAFVAFVTATLFLRTRLHPTSLNDGNLYLATLFYALVHMMFNGFSEMSLMVMRLQVFYKQRDNLFYPGWAFSIPSWILRLPYSVVEAIIWSSVVYYVVGLAPEVGR